MDQKTRIREALAIAIVRQKRKLHREADEWRTKVLRLEEQLAQQKGNSLQIQQWTTSILQKVSEISENQSDSFSKTQQHITDNIFLPPLALEGVCEPGSASSPHQSAYESLKQQLLVAAVTNSCTQSTAAVEVLNGKAAALSDMLLFNVQMLQRLQELVPAAGGHTVRQCSPNKHNSLHVPPYAATEISNFIKDTLLHVPASSLRMSYMKQCAALVAALLTHHPHNTLQEQQQVPKQGVTHAGSQLQELSLAGETNQAEAVALQAVKLMHQLVQCRFCVVSSAEDAMQPLHLQQPLQAGALQAAATCMLQQLSSFPATALLIALTIAQQLQRLLQQMQQANTTMAAVQLGSIGDQLLQLGSNALESATGLFEASHVLMEELDEAIAQLPAWAVALAGCCWTTRALEDIVAVICAMYSCCPELQQHQPLLVTAICQLAASLATRLQQTATNTEAPGMRSGSGAALRSTCGRLCLSLRNLFMPQ